MIPNRLGRSELGVSACGPSFRKSAPAWRAWRIRAQAALACGLLLACRSLLADGNEMLGPVDEDFPIAPGDTFFAAGTGLEDQPSDIVLTIPAGTAVEQVILYWGLRSTSRGDDDVVVNGTTTVTGELIGSSTFSPEARPFVYRADITGLDVIREGRNVVRVSNLNAAGEGDPNGASIVVIAKRGGTGRLQILDGSDFAYWRFNSPLDATVRQKFTVAAAPFAREARLLLIAGDHTPTPGEVDRPSTLEVKVGSAPTQVFNNILKGADGPSWDTIRLPITIPPNATMIEAQLFSDTRTGSKLSPSSFYWVFAGLEAPDGLSISGKVYCDADGDADRDEGEEGLAGVEVSLTCMSGAEMLKKSTFTDDEGFYKFDGIAAGSDCTVAVVPSAALMDKEPTEVCQPHEDLVADVTDCDFGFALPPIVGDTVFCDDNGDGAQQDGEPGIAGVKVSISVPAGGGFPGFASMADTDANGKYLFRIRGVPAGVRVVATVRIDPETGGARGKDLTTPNPQQTIPLGPGGMDLARDFGLMLRRGDARVGDTVFLDADGNGAQNAGEPGLGGVRVSISCPASPGFPGLTDTATTDSQGKYLFTVMDIPEGQEVTCRVSIDPTSGDAAGKELTTPNPQDTIPLGPGDSDLDRDFGLKPRLGDARVGDTVFCDLDGDRTQDPGEPGIAAVPVRLSAPPSGSFPGSEQMATTDSGGKYIFIVGGIPFGSTVIARVSIDTAAGALAGKVLTTANPQDTRPLGPGGEDLDRDFGLKPLAARVGDTVFLDRNGNGFQDPGEPGIPGVAVEIDAPATGAFGGYSNNATTDANGKYLFTVEGIPPATPVIARVEIDPETGGAAGLVLTTPNPQNTVPLGPGVEDLNRDFGLRPSEVVVKTCIEEKTARAGECVDVRVLLSSSQAVEGFVTAIRHDPAAVTLDSITTAGTATETNRADFTSFEVLADGGTAAVVMDLEAPFEGNTIPAGTSIPVVVYRYCCKALPAGSSPRTTRLRFVQGELGTPPKENAVVIGGRSFTPEFCEGSITCLPADEPDGPYFICGGPEQGPDRQPIPARGAPGERVELCFYYCNPEDNLPGHPQFDHLQGVSMAVCFDCRLQCLEGSFRVPEDSILSALEADFVSFQCENDPQDGDGCEMILSVLIDALPPFDGETLPPTEIPLKLACVDMRIADDAPCGACLAVEFCDGADGRGKVPVKNLYAAENQSFPAATVNCAICVAPIPVFRRGDCNSDGRTNLPDGAAIVSFLFMSSAPFEPPCIDSCDANDDGRVDIADTVRILNWLFRDAPEPGAPGPWEAGLDPTEDKLPCDGAPCPPGSGV